MTVLKFGDHVEDDVDITSHVIYFTIGGAKDVRLVVVNKGATNTLVVNSVTAWADPQNSMGRVSAIPSDIMTEVIAIDPVSPVGTNAEADIKFVNAEDFTHIEVDFETTGAGAELTDVRIYCTGRPD